MKPIRLRVVVVVLLAVLLISGLGLQVCWYNTEVPEGFERLNFAAFSQKAMVNDINYERANSDVRKLNGKRVFVKGYMYPEGINEGLTTFILCKDKQKPGFGPAPKLSEMIKVRMAMGYSATYCEGLVSVAGEFRIRDLTKTRNLEPAFELKAKQSGPSKTFF